MLFKTSAIGEVSQHLECIFPFKLTYLDKLLLTFLKDTEFISHMYVLAYILGDFRLCSVNSLCNLYIRRVSRLIIGKNFHSYIAIFYCFKDNIFVFMGFFFLISILHNALTIVQIVILCTIEIYFGKYKFISV